MLHSSLLGRLVVVLWVEAFVALGPTDASSQELGRVYIEALDGAGLPVSDLTPADFTIAEDGVKAKVVSAKRGDTPMRVALLVDNGELIRETNGDNALRSGLNAFLETLPPQHDIALFTIARTIRRRVDFTVDRDELRDGVESVNGIRNPSALMLDGLKEIWEQQFEDDVAFPVFVLLLTDGTEGSDSYNDDEYAELVSMLVSNDITVHTVMLNRNRLRCQRCTSSYAPELTQYGGGIYETITLPTGYSQALTSIATRMGEHFDQMSNRYRVVYERPDPPGEQLSLQLGRPNVSVRLFFNRRMPQ